MKTFFLSFFLCISLGVFAQGTQEEQDNNFAEFENLTHDFGKISDQEDVTYEFNFQNTSGKDLILNPPKASCGCTSPYYPKEPIAPGATEKITVKYSAKNRPGRFLKDIRVYAQGYDQPIVLRIKGEVQTQQEASTMPKKKSNSLFK